MGNISYFFLSKGKINELKGQAVVAHTSSAAESYVQKVKEINARNDWKNKGKGAMFMGMHVPNGEGDPAMPVVTGIAAWENNTLAYTLNTGAAAGVYWKNPSTPLEKDGYILVKQETNLFGLDAHGGKMATSVAESPIERHIAVISPEDNSISVCTEGDCFDRNPRWSRAEKDVLLYDSCGQGFDEKMQFVKFGPRSVYRMHIRTGELEEILVGGKMEYLQPFEAADGTLYCLRHPYEGRGKSEMTPLDVLFLPVRVLKGLFGWLNFFTQRYAGESLKSGGANPAKTKPKSEEELFVEGNLLEAEKNMKDNLSRGEKHAGYVPQAWELVARGADGGFTVLKKGVLDYSVQPDGAIVYSNGKHLVRLDGKEETLLGAAHLGVKPVALASE